MLKTTTPTNAPSNANTLNFVIFSLNTKYAAMTINNGFMLNIKVDLEAGTNFKPKNIVGIPMPPAIHLNSIILLYPFLIPKMLTLSLYVSIKHITVIEVLLINK